jgi:hypothetical protein
VSQFNLIGLEIHSSRMWRWASVLSALDVMERTGMNALIFHQNDLIDQLVYPERYFSVETMWKRWPVRMHTVDNNRQYIRRVVAEANRRGIDFYLEVKELYYPEGLLELHPELRRADGAICASAPFWLEFLEAKTREMLEAIPEIAGIIVSPATRESKVSISTNTCTCEACQQADPGEWYYRLLDAMFRPLHEKGKTLVLRDFAYSAAQQNLAIDAAARCSPEIVIALKNTPHDFYPTFPDNPRIGNIGDRQQWVEFDTWGQFFGIGFFPCSVVEDMQRRLQYCRERGVNGVWFRTDWEVLTEGSSFNSFNLLNVFAGGLLGNNPDLPLAEVYRAWAEYGLLSAIQPESCRAKPVPVLEPAAVERLKQFMIASWSVMEKAVYVRGHIIHEDMMFPATVRLAFDMMVKIHGRDDWDPGASGLVEPTAANIEAVLAEKLAALEEVKALPDLLRPRQLGLPEELTIELETMLDLYEWYVEGFYLATAACYLARKTELSHQSSDRSEAGRWLAELSGYRDRLIERLKGSAYPHYVYWLLDTDRLRGLIADISRILQG